MSRAGPDDNGDTFSSIWNGKLFIMKNVHSGVERRSLDSSGGMLLNAVADPFTM